MPKWKIGPLGDLVVHGGLLGGPGGLLGDHHQVDLGGLLEGHRLVGLGNLEDHHLADLGDLGDLHLIFEQLENQISFQME